MSAPSATAPTAPPPPAPQRSRRRGVELSLIVAAVLVSMYGYAEVGLARNGAVPPGTLGYGAGLAGLALLAHLAVRTCAAYADPLLLPIAVLLNGIGLVLIYRLDLEPSLGPRAAPAQLIWSATG
ncbi:MAG: FtsW/RodA/SpoVE family cell cycle protein, partial [Streptosporangiales bacterium]|nr:FtsW/RodA/SpoVE family cell cycle protein [Streptosporangiales bacterium]